MGQVGKVGRANRECPPQEEEKRQKKPHASMTRLLSKRNALVVQRCRCAASAANWAIGRAAISSTVMVG